MQNYVYCYFLHKKKYEYEYEYEYCQSIYKRPCTAPTAITAAIQTIFFNASNKDNFIILFSWIYIKVFLYVLKRQNCTCII